MNDDKNNEIDLEGLHVGIDEAVKNFSDTIKTPKTYFLDGEWGAGKTEFLNAVSDESEYKFNFLELWNIKDERTVAEIGFSKLFRYRYWLLKILGVFSVLVAITMTPQVNFGIEGFLSNCFGERHSIMILRISTLFALGYIAWQFFKYKSDEVYANCLKKFSFKNKVLVIDDFDRVSESKQEQAYKLFNLLKGRLPIIFVGDYNKLSQSKPDNYLQKIIDQKISLPYGLQSKQIWQSYFQVLAEKFEVNNLEVIEKLMIQEGRNLRDREHFNNIVNKEFFVRGKFKHVVPLQQLAIIYLYLFYPNQYTRLLRDEELEISPEYKDYKEKIRASSYQRKLNTSFEGEKTKLDLIHDILQDEAQYGNFMKQRSSYFINEAISNLSEKDIQKILDDEVKLEELVGNSAHSSYNDFFDYLIKNFDRDIQPKTKESLLDISLTKIKKGINLEKDSLSTHIIRMKDLELLPRKEFMYSENGVSFWSSPIEISGLSDEEVDKKRIKKWDKILTEYKFDKSEKMIFLKLYVFYSWKALGVIFDNLSLESTEYDKVRYKVPYLLTFLSSHELFNKYDSWQESIWNKVDSLTDDEYLDFFKRLGVFSFYRNTLIVVQYDEFNERVLPGADVLAERVNERLEHLRESGIIESWKLGEKLSDENRVQA